MRLEKWWGDWVTQLLKWVQLLYYQGQAWDRQEFEEVGLMEAKVVGFGIEVGVCMFYIATYHMET